MKKVLIGALAALTLAAAAGAVACSDGGEKQPYEYPYELITNLEIDEGMNIDGVLDEDVYAGNRYMQYSLSNTNVRLTTHFGEKGLYVGCVIKDNYIYHNKPYLMDANSSMYLYIVPTDVIKNGTQTLQIAADTQNIWSANYVLFDAATTVQGGDVNTGNSEGMTLEYFVPWQELGLDEKPETVKIFPTYNHVSAQGVSSGLKLSPIGNWGKPFMYYLFDADGYINEDAEGAIVGDSATGIAKSAGWDLTGLSSETPSVRSVEDDAQIVFFKNALTSSYVIESTIRVNGIIRGNTGPKVGLLTGYDGNEMSSTYNQKSGFLFDVSASYYDGNAEKADRVYAKYIDMYTSGWVSTDFVYTNTKALDAGGLNYEDGVHMKAIKDGKWFYLYVNDTLCYITGVDYLAGDVMPGLISIGCEAVFSDFSFTDYAGREAELKELIAEDAYMFEVNQTGDGDISFVKPAVIRDPDTSVVAAAEDFAKIFVLPASGSRLTSFKVNGDDYLAQLKAGTNEGEYVFENVDSDLVIDAAFEAFESYATVEVSFGGTEVGTALSNAALTVLSKDDPMMIYTPRLSVKTESGRRLAKANVILPAGTYEFRCAADGHVTKSLLITVTEADLGKTLTQETATLQPRTQYGADAEGDGWTLSSSGEIDYTYEADGTFGLGKNAVMYFSETSEKCILTATVCDVQKGDGSRDLKAGLIIGAEGGTVRSVIADQVNDDIKLLTMTPGHKWSDFKTIPESCADLTEEGFELTLLKETENGTCTVYVFVNGEYFNTIQFEVSGATACGLITIGSTARFENAEYVTDFSVQENAARFDQLKALAQ